MKKYIFRFIALLNLTVDQMAMAQPFLNPTGIQGPFYNINIGGVHMYCQAAGTPYNPSPLAAIYLDHSVNQNIGRASYNGYPVIQLGPGFFNSVPPVVAQFWFLHECAHLVVGSNEALSDCCAIKNLRNLGLIYNQAQIRGLLEQVYQMPGSYTHLPGPERAQNIYNCFLMP